ncbi:MAG: radical SAM family heme chaperone HemW [bacterium]
MSNPAISALYVHIPFCHRICPFCSFAVRKNRPSVHRKYLEAVLLETRRRVQDITINDLESLYIGGGTPSVLSSTEIIFLMQGIRQSWPHSRDCQISIECNPEDVQSNYLGTLLNSGVNRLSIGVQSFQQEFLKSLGRNHTIEHLRQNLIALKDVGWTNFNVDLMFGFPNQTLEQFQFDVKKVLEWDPTHLSFYALELAEQTPFGKSERIQKSWQDSQEITTDMYLWATEYLVNNGWEHYEVSNFAKPNYQGRMNQMVWNGSGYLGVGVGAHSYDGKSRWGNLRPLHRYLELLEENCWPTAFTETLTQTEKANEFLMLQLRQTKGLSLKKWEDDFAPKNWMDNHFDVLRAWQKEGLLDWMDDRIVLTKKGLLVADALTAELSL